ncbi:hypothetical protein [Panacagrimonas sp.]|uniref:hypothetical protein n=1 Tax=Panacagrimonas sp. TaxID=2480088 RepID=UPI003B51691B
MDSRSIALSQLDDDPITYWLNLLDFSRDGEPLQGIPGMLALSDCLLVLTVSTQSEQTADDPNTPRVSVAFLDN